MTGSSSLLETTSALRERAAFARDWTKGNIVQNILLLSWPVVLLGALYSVNLILEMIWVGELGAASIAGVGVAGSIVVLVVMAMSGLSAGERAMVARFIGAGDVAMANRIVGQSLVISVAFGAFVAAIGIWFTGPIFSLYGLEADAVAEGVVYLRIVLSGWVTEAFWITSFSVMQASGDSVTPLKIAVAIRIVNAIICPFLVLGWWMFPRLGVAGAAITYIIATGLGMLICLWVLFTGRTRLRLTLSDCRPDFEIVRRILKIGIPASVMGLGKSFSDLVLTWLMIPFGTLALAAHNLVFRIETFMNTPGMGLGTGAGVLVGQNLGAGQPGRAARSGWLATGLVGVFIIVCSVVLLVWPESIIGIFNEPDLVNIGAVFLRIAVAGYLGMAIIYVMQNCISGAGDTLPPMLITLATLWVVRLPLAYFMSRFTGMDVYGVRWSIVIGYVVGGIAYMLYFWRGRWKHKKV
jgi:putative MATE family efflux protein